MTVRKINLVTDFVGTQQLIRADELASQYNRQLFRQGRVYDLKLDYDHDGTETVDVYALAPHWLLRESWKLAFKKFQEYMKEEKAMIPKSRRARWYDFRVDPGVVGFGLVKGVDFSIPGIATNYNPASHVTPSEYHYSTIDSETGTTYTFTLGNVGIGNPLRIVQEYQSALSSNQTPDDISPDTAPYAQLDEDVNDDNVDHLMKDGNSPPYDPDPSYDELVWIKIATLGTSAPGVQRLTTGYFEAPLGLVMIQGYSEATAADTKLTLCYRQGDYKGISARRMEEL